MQNTSLNTTATKAAFTNKSNSDKFKVKPKKLGTAYDNMVILRRDLYYKEVVAAHSARITALTENQIGDIMYRYDKGWLSKKELFGEIEALNSGYPCTDIPVKNIIKVIRARK
jgi:hypothetical protein